MKNLETIGGARIGMANATWPFATLKVSKEKLELNASIVGNLVFHPTDVIAIVPYTQIPLFNQGIRIHHRVENYNSTVIFWTHKSPGSLINDIKQTGFLENTDANISKTDASIIQQQQVGAFPIKKSIAIGAVVLWNLLILSDFITFSISEKKGMPFGHGIIIAHISLLLFSVLPLVSTRFSRLILKEGKNINDIKMFLYFLTFISSMLLIGTLTFRSIAH